jgi:hypothetical protein
MTDEELKQQFGIHLATRLESDAPGRETNWADIDDDDDDWAPATIEWTDGTKITLPSVDDPPAREPTPIPSATTLEAARPKSPKSPAPTQASASPTVKPSGFGGRTGLVLKGAADKPTLVAKPPGPPTPVKSPWAPLPPVDKIAPVTIDIPNQHQQQGRFQQRDPHGFHAMPPPPAKEIAADDFSRAGWREGNSNTSRELFNSQSGRYEPVNERRGPRNDTHSRQPAVLQRPSQSDGPAEPSPAFQTHHTSSQNAPFGRRRTSSNVSGGSGNFTRRMSRGGHEMPPHDMLGVRRPSLAAVSDAPASPRNFSPSGQPPLNQPRNNQTWQNRSPAISHASPISVYGQPVPPVSTTPDIQAPVGLSVDEVFDLQKKEMREKRELAIKRRQEEEAKEEAARKERIRIKLEAMGPPPEKKKDKKELTNEENPVSTQIQTREISDLALSPQISVDPKLIVSDKAEQTAVPTTTNSRSTERSPSNDLRPNGVHRSSAVPTIPAPQENNRSSQPWSSKSPSAWAPPPAPQSTSNVWGPPSNNKTLGNGTFNPELSRVPDMQSSVSRPGPIGPPSRGNGPYQQGRGRDYDSRPSPIGPPSRQTDISQHPQQPRKMAPGWGELPEKLAKEDALSTQEAAAERALRQELQEQGLLPDAPQPAYQDTWRQVNINADGTRSKVHAKVKSVIDSAGPIQIQEEITPQPTFDPRRTLDSAVARSEYPNPTFNENWKGLSVSSTRPSRFFNNSNRDVRLEESNVSIDRPESPSPPPPTMEGHPAYDGGDARHPHINLPKPAPVVRLPPLPAPIGPPKPQPLASFASIVGPPTGPSQQPIRSRFANQDIRQELGITGAIGGNNWKEKINNLFPKNMAVDSSSKQTLDIHAENYNNTVSLPASVSGDLAQDHSSVTSKPAATGCFPEPEMGSLPAVKVPDKAPANAWSLSPTPKMNHTILNAKDVTSSSTVAFETEKPTSDENAPSGASKVSIKLPGQETAIKVNHVATRQRSSRGRGGNRGNRGHRQASESYRGGSVRGRGAPSGLTSPASTVSTPTHSSRGRRGNRGGPVRGNGRGGSNSGVDHAALSTWNNHPPAITS